MVAFDLHVKQIETLGMKAFVHVDESTGYAERVEISDGPTCNIPEPQIQDDVILDGSAIDAMHALVLRACLIGMKRFRNILRTCDESWLKIIDHLNTCATKSFRTQTFIVLKSNDELIESYDFPVHCAIDSIFDDSFVITWFCESPVSPPAFELLLEDHDFDSTVYPPPLKTVKTLEFPGNERSAEVGGLLPSKWYRVTFRAIGGAWCPPETVITKKTCTK